MVTESGIRAVNVKPVGKREVVINLKGIHPNTRDDGVINYLEKYGKIVTNKVVHGVFTEGPLKGFCNSDRAYKIELRPNVNIGTYHVVDGHKITARYPGQKQTCARCFETPNKCPGRGMARNCETAGGLRVEFCDYIQNLWETIGYSPENVELSNHLNGDENIPPGEFKSQEGGHFTPMRPEPLKDTSFVGVSVKTFPKDVDHGAVIELLIMAGLPEENKDDVLMRSNATVTIKNLTNEISSIMIDNLHQKKVMGRKILCNGIVPLTPKKDEQTNENSEHVEQAALVKSPDSASAHGSPIKSILITPSPVAESQLNSSLLDIGISTDIQQFVTDNQVHLKTPDMARRHSLSLRTPPMGSLAAELLDSPSFPPIGSLAKTKSLLMDLKEMSERLSDFGSCKSSSSEQSGGESDSNAFKTMNDRKRGYKKKRKASHTPDKDSFLKKQK